MRAWNGEECLTRLSILGCKDEDMHVIKQYFICAGVRVYGWAVPQSIMVEEKYFLEYFYRRLVPTGTVAKVKALFPS